MISVQNQLMTLTVEKKAVKLTDLKQQ